MTLTINDIKKAITSKRLSDQSLCVHASLKSFGEHIEGGPNAIINGFLEEGCTMMVPAFLYGSIKPPLGHNPPRNGMDDSYPGDPEQEKIFYNPEMNIIDIKEMGAIPAAFLKTSGRLRSSHPICSFAAKGPQAQELIQTQTPQTMLAPLKKLAETGGWILLMGVGLDRMTLIHLAEENAGRRLFYRWAKDKNGQTIVTRTSGCSLGFTKLNDVLLPLAQEVTVGKSLWRIFKADAVVIAAEKAIRSNPLITHCGRKECLRCNDTVAGGPAGWIQAPA